jgi:hypothetical protein
MRGTFRASEIVAKDRRPSVSVRYDSRFRNLPSGNIMGTTDHLHMAATICVSRPY